MSHKIDLTSREVRGFIQGYQAFRDGWTLRQSPYTVEGPDADGWRKGWQVAYDANQEALRDTQS